VSNIGSVVNCEVLNWGGDGKETQVIGCTAPYEVTSFTGMCCWSKGQREEGMSPRCEGNEDIPGGLGRLRVYDT
jgi:hypothetical protein